MFVCTNSTHRKKQLKEVRADKERVRWQNNAAVSLKEMSL